MSTRFSVTFVIQFLFDLAMWVFFAVLGWNAGSDAGSRAPLAAVNCFRTENPKERCFCFVQLAALSQDYLGETDKACAFLQVAPDSP